MDEDWKDSGWEFAVLGFGFGFGGNEEELKAGVGLNDWIAWGNDFWVICGLVWSSFMLNIFGFNGKAVVWVK